MHIATSIRVTLCMVLLLIIRPCWGNDLEPLRYHHPGLVVDLGVGLWAWPLPVDFDHDGDFDLVVSCPDKPYNGTYVFENPGTPSRERPVFLPARRISQGRDNVQLSHRGPSLHILTPNAEYPNFFETGLDQPVPLGVANDFHTFVGKHHAKTRANQWRFLDFDDDGDHDLIVGLDDWSDYGWDDAFDEKGDWTHGPLHGFVYYLANLGNDSSPRYAPPEKILAAGKPIDVFGWPSPNFADFDHDRDLDLICGEFLDRFTYFENQGTRAAPRYAAGQRLMVHGEPLAMDLEMIVPVACDWDVDGDVDLVVGDEDGRVAWIEHTGRVERGLPQFQKPYYFQQQADLVKCGALSTPWVADWDADGDDDLLSGNTAGYVEWFENVAPSTSHEHLPRFAAPRRLRSAGEILRIQAGSNGSIQGPCEAKWGYTSPCIADWDHDGRLDVVLNSIWGRIQWCRNQGSARNPQLGPLTDVEVDWPNEPPKPAWTWWRPTSHQLVTQWRTTPVVVDWDHDGLHDLVMLDPEGFLAWYRRERRGDTLVLLPPQRVFLNEHGDALRLNDKTAGGSGRRKISLVDWDRDGSVDLLINGTNADWYRQTDGPTPAATFVPQGPLASRVLAGHSSSPHWADWNRNGVPDLLVGAEDGHFYYLAR